MSYAAQRREMRFGWSMSVSVLVLLLSASTMAAQEGEAEQAGDVDSGEVESGEVESGEAQWIWSPQEEHNEVPAQTCYFRRVFQASNVEIAEMAITADDEYQLFINGTEVSTGDDWHALDVYDIRPYLIDGVNAICVVCKNREEGAAGLVARVNVRSHGNTDVSYSTDSRWKTSLNETDNWTYRRFDDSKWAAAASFGELGAAQPWGAEMTFDEGAVAGRFTLPVEFRVERVLPPSKVGSVVAMAFDERGQLLISPERGTLQLARDTNQDGILDTVAEFSDAVKNCQGILPLNGKVFAVGDGPDETAFYRINDDDHNGVADSVTTLFKFKGGMGEHGPHAPVLGPDGFIYLALGNHTAVEGLEYDGQSPHRGYYEGDLIQPRYEDAGGHAHGVGVPGGVVIRTDINGSFAEVVAGGFRNEYDIAFDRTGELFTYDSDMEWDVGMPWYRPTRVNHVIPGAEFGWRSGWAKWPTYYVDSLPAIVNVGRGSPTGVEFYGHRMFPVRYHNAMFIADWSFGRIHVVRFNENGGSYTADAEVFLQGRPLNVTDLAVGPDGWLYFSTGGRGTEGGIYRVVWRGNVPPLPPAQGVAEALRQTQLQSAWGRNRVAKIRQSMGNAWNGQIQAAARNPRLNPAQRTRALDLMQLVGPFPSSSLLLELSQDESAEVRAKAAYHMGLHVGQGTGDRLIAMLSDPDARVRRITCEALVRSGQQAPPDRLLPLLGDADRFVAWAARRALERIPTARWRDQILAASDAGVFTQGAVALLINEPNENNVRAILNKSGALMREFVEDDDFIALLRVIELAIIRGDIDPSNIPELSRQLAEEYPSLDVRMNRELTRLLVYLDQGDVLPRFMETLTNDETELSERLHLATHLRFLKRGWEIEDQLTLLKFFDAARELPGGHSFSRYLDTFTRDFVSEMDEDERWAVIAAGESMPGAAFAAVAQLPERLDTEQLERLMALDRRLRAADATTDSELATAIVAMLSRSQSELAMGYLREVFEEDPDRRPVVAMGLAQVPDGENWPLLLRSLPVVEGAAAQEVLTHLIDVDRTPDEPEPVRQVILKGLELKKDGAQHAVALLEHWTGEHFTAPSEADDWDQALEPWQQWFTRTYPNHPPAALPVEPQGTRWTYDELVRFVHSEAGGTGDADAGAKVFEKSQCIKCHRFGNRGEGIGPDLTTISKRFQKKELVASVIFPSQIISDQYASKTVITADGRSISGIVGPAGADEVLILQANGEKIRLAKSDIEEMAPNQISTMPEGLFNTLSLAEIADLFAYLYEAPPQ